jgi:protein SCO1/2
MKYCFFILAIILFGCNAAEQKTKGKSKQLPYYSSAAFTPEWYESNDTSLKNIHTIPSFSFINQDSQMVTNKTFDGKIYVANFFFTSCPGICKNLTNNLKTIQKAFEKDDTVLLLSHSVTPEKDDVKALKVYATNNGVISNKWHLITGNKNDIYNIARQAYFADEDLGKQLTVNDFLHTENVLLIDKHKRIRGIYKGISSLEMQNLIHDIQLLKQEN